MEDVFYLMKAVVTAATLKTFLVKAGYAVDTVPARQDSWLIVRINEARFEWDFVEDISRELPLEPEMIETVSTISPVGGAIISYHTNNLPELRDLLFLVLKQFEGWVGCDDRWQVLYTAETIYQMKCDYAQQGNS
ncbi:MAG: hypothetical protein ABI700_11465 [Chloroflexota bacterium]